MLQDVHLLHLGAIMQIYYPNLPAIEQRTKQLDLTRCTHCSQTRQLISHGFIRKKRVGGKSEAVGKRVFCSNRNRRTGCGRTMQLYLDATIRYLHYAGCVVVAFVAFLMTGLSIASAYQRATGSTTSRHAYRWLTALLAQLSTYRSVVHQPLFHAVVHAVVHDHAHDSAPHSAHDMARHPPIMRKPKAPPKRPRPARLVLLMASVKALFVFCGQPLCAAYQQQLQRPFL